MVARSAVDLLSSRRLPFLLQVLDHRVITTAVPLHSRLPVRAKSCVSIATNTSIPCAPCAEELGEGRIALLPLDHASIQFIVMIKASRLDHIPQVQVLLILSAEEGIEMEDGFKLKALRFMAGH